MSADSSSAPLDAWVAALDERHLKALTPSEVARALRALSSCYVERREKLAAGGALDGAGKRAAFALFYGPQHFLIVRQIAAALQIPPHKEIIDLGCGTGAAGAALATATGAAIRGLDVNRWAAAEADWTYRFFGLRGRAGVASVPSARIPAAPGTLILGAYVANELAEAPREQVLQRLVEASRKGATVLIVEPIARRVNRWWPRWGEAFRQAGGREDEWRFQAPLPARQRSLAKAAGLNATELTARSLYLSTPR